MIKILSIKYEDSNIDKVNIIIRVLEFIDKYEDFEWNIGGIV